MTPHHLALTDEWLAGRAALGVGGDRRSVGRRHRRDRGRAVRLVAPGQPAAALRGGRGRACLEALLDGTADAIATDHAPHTEVDKDVEFGLAATGIGGIETALGVLLEAVDAGLVPLPARSSR